MVKKISVLIICLFVFNINVYALENEMKINPEWLNYMKLSNEDKEKYEAIPEKYIYDYVNDNKNILKTYSVRDYVFADETLSNYFTLLDYNDKKYVNSSKKNQSSLGLCWSFGAIGSAESNMLLNGVKGLEEAIESCDENDITSLACAYKKDKETNDAYSSGTATELATFSDRIADYITSKPKDAKAYNRTGTYTVITEGYNPYTTNRTFGSGGNFSTVGKLYSYGISPTRTLNEWASYNTNLTEMSLSQVYDSVDNIYQVTDYYNYPSAPSNATAKEEWIENLKKNVMKYGSVYVSTVAPQSSSARSCYYYDTKYNIDGQKQYIHLINYDGNCGSGSLGWHAMQIIGWDDDYTFGYCKINNTSSGNYTKETCEAAGNIWTEGKGAWILKNSWGSTKTYPYLSYQSKGLSISGVREVSVKNYDYGYNSLSALLYQTSSRVTLNGKIAYEKIYRYKKSSNTEYLTGVNVTYNSNNSDYQVYISSDGEIYDLISEGKVDYTGLRTYTVDNKKLDGDYFYVKVINSSVGSVNAFTKSSCSIDNTCNNEPNIETVTEQKTYEEGTKTFNIFTQTQNLKSGTKLSYKIYNSKNEDITNLFSIPETYVIKGMDKVKITTSTELDSGKYILKTSSNDITYETDFYILGEEITLSLKSPEIIYLDDTNVKITPEISSTIGINKYIWSSSNKEVADVDDNGNLTLNNSGKTTINLTLDTYTGEVSSEIEIIVYKKINKIDDFIDALVDGDNYRAYYLTKDLDFNGINFEEYNLANIFNSIVEGNYYTLKNIEKDTALFSYIENAEIRNIKIMDSKFNGEEFAGSLAGVSDNSIISGIYNESTINGKSIAGGIIGMAIDTTISESYNGGTVSIITDENITYIGGIVGKSIGSTINDSYNTGKITSNIKKANTTETETACYASGIIGESTDTYLKNTYNTGIVSAESNTETKYIFKSGLTNDFSHITNSYYLHDDNYNMVEESLEKTLDELKMKATYLNWDFYNVWKIVEGKATPVLRKYPLEVTNIDFNIFSKTLNTDYNYDFTYEVVPYGSSDEVEIISEDTNLFTVKNNKIITKTKEGSSYITFKVEGKEYSFPITIIDLFDIEYDNSLTGTKLDVNINYNYYLSKLDGEYLKLVYNINGEENEHSFEKNVISDKYSFTVYNNGIVSLGLYLCKDTCALKYEKSFEITNIDKTNPMIEYSADNIRKTLKINITDENGLSENNDYSYGLSSSKSIMPTTFKKYELNKTFTDLSLNNENYYLWIKRNYDKSGNGTCDTPYCIYKLELEDNYYNLYYYDEDQITLLGKYRLLENTVIKPIASPTKSPNDNFDYEFSNWIGYTDGMKLTKETKLIAKYKGIFRGLSSYTYVIENKTIKEIKTDNINATYSVDKFKSNVSSTEIYNFYENDKITSPSYIKTGLIYKSKFRTFKIALAGDVTGDGYIKMNDVMKIANHIVNNNVLYNEYYTAGDVTGDGKVKMNDIMKIASGIVNGGSL